MKKNHSTSSSVAPSSATVFHLTDAQNEVAEKLLKKKSINDAITICANKMVKYKHYNTPGFSSRDLCYNELVQAGWVGVCKAVETYNPNHVSATNGQTASLETLAISLAKYEIWSEHNKQQGLSPAEARSKRKIIAAVRDIAQERGCQPFEVSDEDVAERIKVKVATVRKYRQTIISVDFSNEDCDDEENCNVCDRSESRPMYNNAVTGKNRDLAGIVVKDIPFTQCALPDTLNTALDNLEDDEKIAITWHYGLFGTPKMSNKAIAQKLGISPSALSMKLDVVRDKLHFYLVKSSSVENATSPVFEKYQKNWKSKVPNKDDLKPKDEIRSIFL